MTLTGGQMGFLVLAGLGAGLVNGAAGGGTLVSFPALLAVGYPAITANVTSTVGIWPGYLGGIAGFRSEIRDQGDRLRSLVWTVVAGAVVGGVLLLSTPSTAFTRLAPYLLLFSCLLFATQPILAKRLRARSDRLERSHRIGLYCGVFGASTYGAYFGAGLGVVLLAVLGLCMDETLNRINGLRAVLAFIVNTVAVALFALRADVAWSAAVLMVGSSLIGGYIGSRVARRIPAILLRVIILGLGVATAIYLLLA